MTGLSCVSVGSKMGSVWAVRANGKVYQKAEPEEGVTDLSSNTGWVLVDKDLEIGMAVPMKAVASSDYY